MIDNYKTLPLGKYIDICQVLKDENLEELDKQVKMISILSDMSEEEVLHLPLTQYREMALKAAFLSEPDKNRHKAARKYILGKWVLVPTYDYRKIETAQYVDFQTFAPLCETKMAELLSCLLVPEGHRYNEGYDILEVQQVLRDELSVTDAIALSAFFLKKYESLIVATLNYCAEEMKRLTPAQKEKMKEKMKGLTILSQLSGAGLRM